VPSSLYQAPASRLRLFSQAAGQTVTVDCPIQLEEIGNTVVTADRRLPIEGLAMQVGDAAAQVELLASQNPPPLRTEWLASVSDDCAVPIESGGEVGRSFDLVAPIENSAGLQFQDGPVVEALATNRADAVVQLTADALAGRAPGANVPVEWLAAQTAALTEDAILPLEWEATTPAPLLSLDSSPEHIRLLATPGRVRLLRRR
jgi:hypothetical protein